MSGPQNGDLVYIPQAVTLLDVSDCQEDDPQLTIPLRVWETDVPTVGVIVETRDAQGYLQVYCEGEKWAVSGAHVYPVEPKEN